MYESGHGLLNAEYVTIKSLTNLSGFNLKMAKRSQRAMLLNGQI